MIIGHEVGDITSPQNSRDIIIAMNSSLEDVRGIGKPFVGDKILQNGELELGSVLTYDFSNDGRRLHMLICHKIGKGGWADAPQYIRFGLDHLWFHEGDRNYSIVNIGEGRVGKRDGADVAANNQAIATSFLKVTQFSLGDGETAVAIALQQVPPIIVWQPSHGYQDPPMRVAA